MNPLLADPPAPPAPSAPAPAVERAPAPERTCANCGSPMRAQQDWCLECGAGAPDRLGRRPGWRSATTVVGATVLLALSAVGASYAALNSDSKKAANRPAVLAQVPPAVATPTPTGAPPAPGAAVPTPGAVPAPGTAKPPKIPKVTPTPAPGAVAPAVKAPAAGASPSTPRTTAPKSSAPKTTVAPKAAPAPHKTVPEGTPGTKVVLDTNAAITYNPYGYTPSRFGDPANAIDGDAGTAWTAGIDPATAPHMAVGLDINLKSSQRVSKLDLVTTTPGMTAEIYGATGSQPPSITDPGWIHLSPPHAAQRHEHINLQAGGRAMRHLLIWISRAPSPTGANPPTFVAVNEVAVIH